MKIDINQCIYTGIVFMFCTHAYMLCRCVCVHAAYVRLCSCCIRALVFMLHTCACVHAAYVLLCSCCIRALVFMLHT